MPREAACLEEFPEQCFSLRLYLTGLAAGRPAGSAERTARRGHASGPGSAPALSPRRLVRGARHGDAAHAPPCRLQEGTAGAGRRGTREPLRRGHVPRRFPERDTLEGPGHGSLCDRLCPGREAGSAARQPRRRHLPCARGRGAGRRLGPPDPPQVTSRACPPAPRRPLHPSRPSAPPSFLPPCSCARARSDYAMKSRD